MDAKDPFLMPIMAAEGAARRDLHSVKLPK
jgi:hypothetical protein